MKNNIILCGIGENTILISKNRLVKITVVIFPPLRRSQNVHSVDNINSRMFVMMLKIASV